MPFTSVIELTTQGLAATQKAQFHELWKPTGLPCNSCPSPEVYFLMISCISNSFTCTCQTVSEVNLDFKLHPILSHVSTNSRCPASIFRSTDEPWEMRKLTVIWVSQATFFPPPISCPGPALQGD